MPTPTEPECGLSAAPGAPASGEADCGASGHGGSVA